MNAAMTGVISRKESLGHRVPPRLGVGRASPGRKGCVSEAFSEAFSEACVEAVLWVKDWLPDMDLNHDKQIQSLLCYRYTIGQAGAVGTLAG